MLKRALDYILFGNVFIALCAAVWAYSTYSVLDLPASSVDYRLLLLIFAGVVVVYVLDRLDTFERITDRVKRPRHRWIEEHRGSMRALLVGAAAAVVGLLWFVNARAVLLLGVLGAVSIAYSLPLFRGFKVGLKDFGLAKIFLIGLVWSSVTTLLPPIEAGRAVLSRDVALLLVERFLFVFAITLPFDVRDMEIDRAQGIRTIPTVIGVTASRRLIAATLVIYLWLKALHYYPAHAIMLVPASVTVAYAGLLLLQLGRRGDEYYYSLLWDGAILLQAVLAVAFEKA